MKYLVVSKFYDDLSCEVFLIKTDVEQEPFFQFSKNYDLYVDDFGSEEEALMFIANELETSPNNVERLNYFADLGFLYEMDS